MNASDIWIKDDLRLRNINFSTNSSIIVIWESTEVNEVSLMKLINNMKIRII